MKKPTHPFRVKKASTRFRLCIAGTKRIKELICWVWEKTSSWFSSASSRVIGRLLYSYVKGGQKIKRFKKITSTVLDKTISRTINMKAEPCVICFSPVQKEDETKHMCHGKLLHKSCMQTAILHGIRTCPLCRSSVPSRMLSEDFRILLKHASYCRDLECRAVDCTKMKELMLHAKECRFTRGCDYCQKLAVQLHYHHSECMDLFCKVPMCFFPWKDD